MSSYQHLQQKELELKCKDVLARYENLVKQGTPLDMTRSKPGFDQMNVSDKIFALVSTNNGFRNFGLCRRVSGIGKIA